MMSANLLGISLKEHPEGLLALFLGPAEAAYYSQSVGWFDCYHLQRLP